MSYWVDLHIPSCCADRLHLISEVEGCTVEEMLVRLFMVGMSAYGVLSTLRTANGEQMSCEWTTEHLARLFAEREG
jgi:hypothetical protein